MHVHTHPDHVNQNHVDIAALRNDVAELTAAVVALIALLDTTDTY